MKVTARDWRHNLPSGNGVCMHADPSSDRDGLQSPVWLDLKLLQCTFTCNTQPVDALPCCSVCACRCGRSTRSSGAGLQLRKSSLMLGRWVLGFPHVGPAFLCLSRCSCALIISLITPVMFHLFAPVLIYRGPQLLVLCYMTCSCTVAASLPSIDGHLEAAVICCVAAAAATADLGPDPS